MTGSMRRLAGLWCALSLGGCAATVTCPTGPDATDPVFLLDHGRHSSLVLPAPDGRLVRYSYGDRRWYAEVDTGFWQGAAALLRRTPAVLGRRELYGDPVSDEVVRALRVGVEYAYTLQTTPDAAAALVARLEALFRAGAEAKRFNPDYDLEFVPHPRDYTGWHNSNHVVADWLRELGCEVGGSPIVSRWRVRER